MNLQFDPGLLMNGLEQTTVPQKLKHKGGPWFLQKCKWNRQLPPHTLYGPGKEYA